jgi:hypothetical protein
LRSSPSTKAQLAEGEFVEVTRRGYPARRFKYSATILPLSRLSPCYLSY